MTIKFTYHEGSQAEEPLAVDTESSKGTVYLRRNIEQIERKDEQTGETVTLWGYEEAQLTHEEYALYLGEDNSAKIEYVAMMSDIEL